MALTVAAAPFAEANATSNYLVSSVDNRSDPSAIHCFDAATGFSGVCLYASHDLGSGTAPDGGSYPMDGTFLYTIADGQDPTVQSNWVARGQVLSEGNQYSSWANGNKHLWAPEAAQTYDGTTYLYVPDTTTASDRYSSVIGLSTAPAPWGPFTNNPSHKFLTGTTFNVKNTSGQTVSSKYASDPSPMQDMSGQRWLVWATGDGGNCGGLAIGKLTSDLTDIQAGTQHMINITGWPGNLPNCSKVQGVTHPYLEGATMYWSAPWGGTPGTFTLEFAAQTTAGKEAVAYATGDDADGTFTYKGTLMAESSTEYTDQGTIVDNPAFNDGLHKLFIYHDGPSGAKNRKVHAECLVPNGSLSKMTRSPGNADTANNFSNCAAPPPTNCPSYVANHFMGSSAYGAQWATDSNLSRAYWTGNKSAMCQYYGLIHTSAGGNTSSSYGYWQSGPSQI